MSFSVVFILMIFAHIVDDFYLQGILAKMKQKSWWREQPEYTDKYEDDYFCALIIHSLSWSIMIALPILYVTAFNPASWLYFVIGCNAVIHAIVDDLKANKKKINLWQDQLIHFAQIFLTFSLFAIFK